MRINVVRFIVFLNGLVCVAQQTTSIPTLSPIPIAPGQLITFLIPDNGAGPKTPVRASAPLPTSLAGISVIVRSNADHLAPILDVRAIRTCYTGDPPPNDSCGSAIAVTVQVPFDIATVCASCGQPTPPTSVAITLNGATEQFNAVLPLLDQVHIMTVCDVLVAGASPPGTCLPLVVHANGNMVTSANPARVGEELVAYATGLGQTITPTTTGHLIPSAATTTSAFALDFNYRVNALATKPTGARMRFVEPPNLAPIFVGATPGFIGLYQVNFIVPPPPLDLAPCTDLTRIGPFGNAVQSNFTVSIGSVYSFDGAGICVLPGS